MPTEQQGESQRLMEKKIVLAEYASEYTIPQLTQDQLNIANKVIKVLDTVEEVTKFISADATAISVIIPFVHILTKMLSQNEEDSEVRIIKIEIKNIITA